MRRSICSRKVKMLALFVLLLTSVLLFAHPGSGIVVDKNGDVYFTDTGKGVWKIEAGGKLIFIPASRFHWMTLDQEGNFSRSRGSFGTYFEGLTPEGSKPTLIMCSDFPLVTGRDGNIYYVNTRPAVSTIFRRTPGGKESVIAANRIFEHVSGIAAGADGSLYITEASNANSNTVRKVAMNGSISLVATYPGKKIKEPPLDTRPSYCRGLAVDPSGIIYVAATGSRSVLKITAKGAITTLLETQAPWTPTGIALFQGEIFILEWHDVSAENLEVRTAYIPRVRKIGRDGKVTTVATVSR